MTTLLVTGTSGHLGRLVVEDLLARGVAPADVVATARDTAAVADLAERGVDVRRADYDDPATLTAAFAGVDRALLVSSTTDGDRVAQHRAVIEAAAAAGVELLAYTGVVNAGRSTMLLAADHQATEKLLASSGLSTVVLRNSWYHENWTDQLADHLDRGTIVGSAGQGRVSAASRADYAAAAAAVLTDPDTSTRVLELGGDTAFTLADLAAVISEVAGRPVAYQDVPVEQYTEILRGAGLPAPVADVVADIDRGLADGELETTSGDLSRTIGRPTTPLRQVVQDAVARLSPTA